MHAERIDSLTEEILAGYERLALLALLEAEHPYTRAELQRELAGSHGDPLDTAGAIDALQAVGLVNLEGRLVFPSRAARAMDELIGICL
jgi:hypothetical protein